MSPRSSAIVAVAMRRIPATTEAAPSMVGAVDRPRHSTRALTMAEVKARGFVVYRDGVYDLARFSNSHPGGDFLRSLAGQCATVAIDNAHGERFAVAQALRRFYVGPFDPASEDPVERDLRVLRTEFRREGLFDYGRARMALDVTRWMFLFGAAALALSCWTLLAGTLLLAGTIDVVWWIHDAGHNAVFRRERTARRVIEWLGIAILGMPQQGYHYGIHRIHHGFPNVVGVDRALETGPLSWDVESAAEKPALFRRGRLVQWFFFVVPLAGPGLLASALGAAFARRQYGLLAATLVRWIAVIALCHRADLLPLAFTPWAAGSILAFMAGLNHFHLPMSASAPSSYVRAVFERTQNVKGAGLLWHWVSGGLDLHIEHHLFPTMPSFRYRKIAARVRAFAEQHGLPYRTTTPRGAVLNLVETLRRPLVDESRRTRTPAKCPFHALLGRSS